MSGSTLDDIYINVNLVVCNRDHLYENLINPDWTRKDEDRSNDPKPSEEPVE